MPASLDPRFTYGLGSVCCHSQIVWGQVPVPIL